MSFKENDRVQITADFGSTLGKTGTITKVYTESGGYLVQIDEVGRVMGFFDSELVLLDPKREALITLAETLDSARKQANGINGMDGAVYREIKRVMEDVLMAFTEFDQTGQVLDAMVEDGLSVREALREVEK